jgi:hypothetical protein
VGRSHGQTDYLDEIIGAGASFIVTVSTNTSLFISLRNEETELNKFSEFDNISVKELPGNHATQGTADKRPTLARVPVGGRRNLLEYTEEFDNAVWVKNGLSPIDEAAATAPDGTLTANELVETATNDWHRMLAPFTAESGTTYTATIYVKASSGGRYLQYINSLAAFPSGYANFDIDNGEVATTSGVTATIEELPNAWYRCRVTQTANATSSANVVWLLQPNDAARNNQYLGNGTSGIYLWGAQIETGSTATDYQKVVSEYDVTEAGVDSVDYLSFNGTSNGMVTASIDFTSTDKMSVFAGVRKLDDSAVGIITEFTNVSTNPRAFSLFAGNTTSTRRFSWSTATPQAFIGTADFAGDQTVVDTLTIDRSGTTTTTILFPRLNGAADIQSEVVNANPGGNFANDSLYIGYRGSGGSFLNGNLYGLIVRGAASTTGEITNTETYLGTRTGLYAPVITGLPTIGVS